MQCARGEIIEIHVSFHVFDTGSNYTVLSSQHGPGAWREWTGFVDSAYLIVGFFDLILPFVDLIFIIFQNEDDLDDWIELVMQVDLDGRAYAYARIILPVMIVPLMRSRCLL